MDENGDAIKNGIHVQCAPSTSKESVPHPASSCGSIGPPLSPTGSAASSVATAVSSTSKPSSVHNVTMESWPACGTAPSSSSLTSSNLTPSSSRSGRGLFSRDSPASSISKARVVQSLHVNLPSREKLVSVQTLTKETIAIAVTSKCQVWDVFHVACVHLRIEDDRFFGLAVRSPSEGLGGDRPRHEYYFLQFDQKISKYLPKQSRFGKNPPIEKNRPTLALYLRVRIYIDRVDLIQCPVALHHYYMQLRENLLDQWSGSNSVSAERCWALAALALQTDKSETDDMDYFRPEKYFPLWVINSHGLEFVRKSMPGILNSDTSRRLTQREAMFQFCQEASRSPYALNCHLYGLRRQKNDMTDNALIGITDAGIDMWDIGEDGDRSPLRSLAWSKMARLSFDRKRLSIGGLDGSKMSLYAQSETKARYLLLFCREVHQALLQIHLHFANLRPHSSMTLPPGWGSERLVDSPSGPRTASNAHSAQSSMSASACNSVISTSSKQDARQSPSLSVDSKRAVNKIKGTPHPNERRNAAAHAKPRVCGRPRTPLSFNAASQLPNGPTSEAGASDLNSLNVEEDEVGASEIEMALNSAPSPPRVAISDHRDLDNFEQLDERVDRSAAARDSANHMANRTGSIVSSCTMSSHQSQRSNASQNEHATSSTHELPAVTSDFADVVVQNGRLPQINEGPAAGVQSATSRSMHDLRTVNVATPQFNGQMDAIRQPPRYTDAVAQLHRNRIVQLQEMHQQRSLPEVAARSQAHVKQARWTTVAGDGADPDLLDILERMRLQQQHENMQRLHQHNIQMQQLPNFPYGPSLAKSEPRLNGEIGAYYNDPQQALPESSGRMRRMNEPVQPAAQAKRRFASRSPASRGINRVKSLPSAQIAMLANGMPRTNGSALPPSANPTVAQYVAAQSESVGAVAPPSYSDALELRQRQMLQLNGPITMPVAEQQSVSRSSVEHNGMSHIADVEANRTVPPAVPSSQKLKNFPMMHMLLEDNGTAGTSSSSSTEGPVIPPCDYEENETGSFNGVGSADKYRMPHQEYHDPSMPANASAQMPAWLPVVPPLSSAVPYFVNGPVSSTAALAAALRSSNSDSQSHTAGSYANNYFPGAWQDDAYYMKHHSSGNTQRGEYVFDENLRFASPYSAKYALGALKTPPPHRSAAITKNINGIPSHLPPPSSSGQVMDLPPPPHYSQSTSAPSRNAPLVM